MSYTFRIVVSPVNRSAGDAILLVEWGGFFFVLSIPRWGKKGLIESSNQYCGCCAQALF